MDDKVKRTVKIIDRMVMLYKIRQEYDHSRPATEYNTDVDSSVKQIVEGDDHVLKLDATLKNQFDTAFDSDFSNVKIHTGRYANELTREVNADAVTIGNDIYFAAGRYSPDTAEGIKLLAHELQHVIQFQNNNRMVYLEDISGLENEAENVETLMDDMRLHNITTPLLSQSGLPDTGSTEMAQNQAEALQKGKESTDSLDDFTGRRNKPVIEITLSNGKKVIVELAQYELIKDEVKKYWEETLMEKKNLLTEEDYEEYMINFIGFLNNRL